MSHLYHYRVSGFCFSSFRHDGFCLFACLLVCMFVLFSCFVLFLFVCFLVCCLVSLSVGLIFCLSTFLPVCQSVCLCCFFFRFCPLPILATRQCSIKITDVSKEKILYLIKLTMTFSLPAHITTYSKKETSLS